MLLAVFFDKEAGSQKDYMKGEADKYLEQTKKRIELLNEVPWNLNSGCNGLHFAAWHVMADTSGEKESAGKEGSG